MKLVITILVSSFIILPGAITLGQENSNQDSIKFVKQGDSILYKVAALPNHKLDSAVFYIEAAIDNYYKAKSWEKYAESLSAMTTYHFYRDDLAQLETYSQKSIIETKRVLGIDHPFYAKALNNSATISRKRGDYDQAIKLLNQALEINDENDALFLERASNYQNLAVNHKLKEELQKALNFRKKALRENLKILEKDSPILGINYKNIGLAYKELNLLDSAAYYLKKGLFILQEGINLGNNQTQRNVIMTLHGIAEVWLLKSNTKQAKQVINEVLEIQKSDNAFRKAFSYELLAKIYLEENKPNEALAAVITANKLAQINYKKSYYRIIARKFLLTAEIFEKQNKLDSALYYSQKALSVLSPSFNFIEEWSNTPPDKLLAKADALNILIFKASILKQLYAQNKDQRHLSLAIDTYDSAIDLIRNRRQGILSENSKNNLAVKSLKIYEHAISSYLEMYAISENSKYKRKALLLAESNKALLLLEFLNEKIAKGKSEIADSLLNKEKKFRIDIAYYQKKILLEQQRDDKADHKKVQSLQNELFEIQEDYNLLIGKMEALYPDYYQLKYKNEPTSIDEIKSNLVSSKTALIEYFLGEENVYLFCLTANDLQVVKLDIIDLPNQIHNLRSRVSNPPKDGMSSSEIEEFWKSSYQCYDQILRPAIEQLPSDINELFIIPDGILAYVPFDLLLTQPINKNNIKLPEAADYLLTRYLISYDYSATLLVKNNVKKDIQFTSDFIAYAPSFNGQITMLRNCDGAQLSQLQCNEEEVENIGLILNGTINTDQAASASNFVNSNKKSRIIHLATHACVDDQNPMLNKVFFSDNSLTLLDFYNTQLNAELVVLSACNTGMGKIQKGEGVMSIARGFMAAGSPSTMLSLWSVDDCSTSDIMGYYYKNLKAGDKKNKALQKAKLEFLEFAPKAMKHPFYWGAFVQFGNVEAMEFSNGSNLKLWGLAGIGLILLGIFLFYRKRN